MIATIVALALATIVALAYLVATLAKGANSWAVSQAYTLSRQGHIFLSFFVLVSPIALAYLASVSLVIVVMG